jgi:hypothetical protein
MAANSALAYKEPGKIHWHALTSLNDMQTQAFAKYYKLDIVRVPYRDGTQALNDLTENRIQLYSSSYAVARPAVEAGKIQQSRSRRRNAPTPCPTGREEQRVVVVGADELRDGRDGIAARPIFHDHRLPPALGKAVGHQPRANVGSRPG